MAGNSAKGYGKEVKALLSKYGADKLSTLNPVHYAAVVAAAVTDAGFDPYEKKLLGVTAMTTLLGKKRFDELLGGLIYKPPGKPALVPESDKRPAMNSAKDNF